MSKHLQVPVWVMAIGMSVTLIGGGVVGYMTHDAATARQTTTGVPSELKQVVSTYDTIRSNYYQKTSGKKLAAGAINGMLESLGDPYSVYLANTDKSSLDSTISASFGGIGATIEQTGKTLHIQSILPDTPAKHAGLRVGDQLIAVNGKDVASMTVDKAVAKIRGKIGTQVKVTVKRQGTRHTYTMKRAKITTDTVTGALSKQNRHVGIITMATFSEPTATQFEKTVKQLRKKGATGFVLDLRGNPGGMLDSALAIASMCLKDGQTIVKVQNRAGSTQVYKAGKTYDKGFKVKEPLSILIDGNSASASEILSAALNENRAVPLVGEQSFGKGTVQNVASLNSQAEIKLTVAKWLTPKNHWINHKGLTPTVKVAYPAYAKISGIGASSLKPEQTGTDVKAMQQMLAALGFDPGTVNGYYSADTVSAVKAFQEKHGLNATGTADDTTLTTLMQALSAKFTADDPQLKAAVKAAK